MLEQALVFGKNKKTSSGAKLQRSITDVHSYKPFNVKEMEYGIMPED